ncbi:hypothetical protein F7R91_08070 [Streptomyces luteolifulvus]|uniref:Uncharacterized protein n=1 Tax=Streptomyces luteolifulvus TaxID=2615112 RepID=A0A6H9V7G5_9ACTN|nr:hypothetical protein [Streptomyces luteolifulvus]KAB1148728.1 hypothetical protein F7R91_08070 [Streptomyces luteolifulvus]
MSTLAAGEWDGELRLANWSLPLPVLPKDMATAKCRRHGLPRYAKPVPDVTDRFALLVARTNVVKAAVSRLR